jgi:hypothetical protein
MDDAGVFYGNGHKLHKSTPVCDEQTNQRADLTVVIECIQYDSHGLHMCTDSRRCQRSEPMAVTVTSPWVASYGRYTIPKVGQKK